MVTSACAQASGECQEVLKSLQRSGPVRPLSGLEAEPLHGLGVAETFAAVPQGRRARHKPGQPAGQHVRPSAGLSGIERSLSAGAVSHQPNLAMATGSWRQGRAAASGLLSSIPGLLFRHPTSRGSHDS